MSKPSLSLIYTTYRPGGIDLLAMALAPQLPEYELIVVDDYPGRAARGLAQAHLEARGVPLGYYGPSKPKVHQDTPVGLANAMNTGALYARGDYVLFMHDFSYPHPDAVRDWLVSFNENGTKALISGIGRIWEVSPPQCDEDISIWQDQLDPLAHFSKEKGMWIPELWENFYCGMHSRFLEACNGVEELSDGHISWPLECMVAQARLHNYRLVVDRRLRVDIADHRSWKQQADRKRWHAEEHGGGGIEPGWRWWSNPSYSLRDERNKNAGRNGISDLGQSGTAE